MNGPQQRRAPVIPGREGDKDFRSGCIKNWDSIYSGQFRGNVQIIIEDLPYVPQVNSRNILNRIYTRLHVDPNSTRIENVSLL